MKIAVGSVVALAVASLLVAGCSSSGGTTADSNSSSSSSDESAGSADQAIVPREISWLLSRPADGAVIKTMQSVADQYAKDHPGFSLNLITTPDRPSYIQKYETLAAADKLPELFDTDATPFAKKLADQGKMVNVDQMLKDFGLYDDYRPSALAYQKFDDGSLYMIPFEYGAEVFWYNKALFKKAGVDVPTSLDDFPAMCEQLKASGTIPIAIDGADQWPLERWIAYQPFRTDGPDYIKNLKSAGAKFSDPAGKKSAEWLSALGKAQCFEEGFSSVGYADAQALFTTGQAAVYNMGTWELGALATDALDAGVRDDVDFFTLPTVANSATQPNEYVAPSGIGMAVNAKTYDPLVKDFLKFALTNYPAAYAASGALGPTNVEPTIPSNATPLYEKAVQTANDAGKETIMPWDTQLDPTTNTMLQQELTLLVQGDLSSDDFISKMDSTLEQNAPKYFG